MTENNTVFMKAVRAIRAMSCRDAMESAHLNIVCAAPGIRNTIEKVVSGTTTRYKLQHPSRHIELNQIVRFCVILIIQRYHHHMHPAAIANKIMRGLSWRVNEHYDNNPSRSKLRSRARLYMIYVIRAKRAHIEITDVAIAALVGKTAGRIRKLRQAYLIYYHKLGLTDKHVTCIDGRYCQVREQHGLPRSSKIRNYDELRADAYRNGIRRKTCKA